MTVQLGNLWIYTHISHMHVYHTYIYIYIIYLCYHWVVFIKDIHGLTFASVHLQRLLLGPMEASLAEMRLYWTEQKEAKNGRFGTEKRPWLTGFVFCSCFFFETAKPKALKIPGSEKSHSEASGVLILKENLLVYTQVVKLSRLFWTSLTYFGTGHKVLKRAVGCQQDRAQNS